MDRLRVAEEIEAGRQPRFVDGSEVKISDIAVDHNEALIDSIDTALGDLLGTRPREAIYDHLAQQLSLAREDIPTHLDEFRAVLKASFDAAAPKIERFIARRLYATLGWQFLEMKGFGLNEHFEFVKGIVERAKKMNLGE